MENRLRKFDFTAMRPRGRFPVRQLKWCPTMERCRNSRWRGPGSGRGVNAHRAAGADNASSPRAAAAAVRQQRLRPLQHLERGATAAHSTATLKLQFARDGRSSVVARRREGRLFSLPIRRHSYIGSRQVDRPSAMMTCSCRRTAAHLVIFAYRPSVSAATGIARSYSRV